MTLADLVQVLFRASQAKHGLLLRVSDPARAKAAFARAKEAAADAELPPVRLRELQGHPEGNLVILRGGRGDRGGDSASEGETEGDLF